MGNYLIYGLTFTMRERHTIMSKKFYKVVCSQLVYSETIIEAESEDEAQEIAYESDGLDWKEVHYGDWDIEDVELTNEANHE
jgi:hypothetical protein